MIGEMMLGDKFVEAKWSVGKVIVEFPCIFMCAVADPFDEELIVMWVG